MLRVVWVERGGMGRESFQGLLMNPGEGREQGAGNNCCFAGTRLFFGAALVAILHFLA